MIRRIIKGIIDVIRQEIAWYKTRNVMRRQAARLTQ